MLSQDLLKIKLPFPCKTSLGRGRSTYLFSLELGRQDQINFCQNLEKMLHSPLSQIHLIGQNYVSGTSWYEFVILLSNLTQTDVLKYPRLLDGWFMFRQRRQEGSLAYWLAKVCARVVYFSIESLAFMMEGKGVFAHRLSHMCFSFAAGRLCHMPAEVAQPPFQRLS